MKKKSYTTGKAEKRAAKIPRELRALYADDLSAVPLLDFDEKLSVAIMEDGSILDMLSIITKDQDSMSYEEKALDNYLWEILYKIYPEDIKIICFDFLPDTAEQQIYMEHLLARNESPVLKELIIEKKNELVFVSTTDHYIEKQFFLFFYSKDLAAWRENSVNIYSILNRGFLPLAETLSSRKKQQVLFKLNNKNMEGGR